ncbi:E3 ubiquitin ligase PQT3-like isoform X1 [Amborella trichopoda]|uniref:E3 ubiquitin ligase PQT3-like isoform X1 n=1 Tax=Amborella trichopoda TaxID=13333 RepID=UPI0005D39B43|nr:E3 ubiquitin ligase PQT3-like isoform X1 [Amborella trichopoda]|eukprot:XP_011621452.1 E3 ubiquitin ligase PQT3-like isoform X1 [Amborella trichopoda]
MAVYYKFKSAKDFASIPIEGPFITVSNLKEKIFEYKQLGRGNDLMVFNAQTNEEYADEAMLVPKNTSVLVRLVPGRPRLPIVTEREEPKVSETQVDQVSHSKNSSQPPELSQMKLPDESEWDEFGNDLYAIPEPIQVLSSQSSQAQEALPSKADEDSRIKAFINSTASDWQRQTQEAYSSGRGFGRGMGGRMMAGRGFGRGGFERKTPPQGYVCHRCNNPGHFIQHCPTNGDPNFDIKRVKPPTGIPKSMLMATPDGSYALPSGAVAVLKPNEAAFEKEIEGLPSTRTISDLPPELRCPLCKEVMKDAVLTSKCCFKSFCDKCIRDYIISKSMCVCGAMNVLADDLLPNKTLRDTINRILESNTSSAENGGSWLQVQDMESTRCPRPKAPSPTLSGTAKENHTPPSKEAAQKLKETVNDEKAVSQQCLEGNKSAKNVDRSEAATLDTMSMKEPVSQESAPMAEEEVQQKLPAGEQAKKKKKKKIRQPSNANDMQWRASQDFGAENCMMPMAPGAYNPFWPGVQWGMDGYMAAVGGSPYLGYAPTPFDVPFPGVLSQDPFAMQPYMLPVPPQRDLMEYGVGANSAAPVMSREEFEARKADLRRKRENERLIERGSSKDRDGSRDLSITSKEAPSRLKPKLMSQAASVDRPGRESSSVRPHREAPELLRAAAAAPSLKMKAHDVLPPEQPAPNPSDAKRLKGSVFSRISSLTTPLLRLLPHLTVSNKLSNRGPKRAMVMAMKGRYLHPQGGGGQ